MSRFFMLLKSVFAALYSGLFFFMSFFPPIIHIAQAQQQCRQSDPGNQTGSRLRASAYSQNSRSKHKRRSSESDFLSAKRSFFRG